MAITRKQAPTVAVAEAAAAALREHGYDATNTGWLVDSTAGETVVEFAIHEAAGTKRKSPHPDASSGSV